MIHRRTKRLTKRVTDFSTRAVRRLVEGGDVGPKPRPDSLQTPAFTHTLSPRVPWRRPRVRRSRLSRLVTVSVPPRLDLQSQSRPPGRAFARPGRPGRTWQRRLFTNSPLEPPTRYPPHPLNARNLHPRLSLAHRLRFTLSPAQWTRSGWLQPPTSSTRARAEELLRTHRAASAFACCTYSASRSHAS